MTIPAQTNKEQKDAQIGRILELAASLDKAKWFKEENLKKMSSVDREMLLENLEAERQFLDDFCGGGELILEEI
jgi:hypothetical protein